MKVLLLVPPLNKNGGVANFYKTLFPYLENKIDFFTFSTSEHAGTCAKLISLLKDLILFCRLLFRSRYDIVFLNPSLGVTAVIRDGLYCLIAGRLFRKKLFVFWHGWNKEYERHLEYSRISSAFLRFAFFQAETMCVLAKEFKTCLEKWGYQGKILQKTTAFPDELLQFTKISSDKHFTLLFLARLEKAKGIYEAIEYFELLSKQYPAQVRLTIAGSGSEEIKVRDYVKSRQLQNVEFTGYIQGKKKYQLLADADCYLFPSSHGEGLPCSILEAMGAGLPIITSVSGGISDFFEDGKMGFMIPVTARSVWVEKLMELLNKPELRQQIGNFNRQYAQKYFCASKVAEQLLKDLLELYKQGRN